MILLAVLAIATTAASDVPRDFGPHYAFVGEFVSIQEMQPCNQDEPIPDGKTILDYISSECRGFYQIYKATYRVTLPMAGSPPKTDVEIFVADHYGRPGFTNAQNAFLVVSVRDGQAWLQRNLGVSVLPLEDGGWATCGSPFAEQDEDGHPAGEPYARELEFARPLLELRTDDDPAWVAALRADPEVRIEGNTVHCRRGLPVAEVLEDLRGSLDERGVTFEPDSAKP